MSQAITNQPEDRRKKNEEDFKAFNESNRQAMEKVMDEESIQTFPLGLVCECSDANCTDRIELTVAQRRQIRKDKDEFIIIPGHQDNQIEKVVEQHQSFALVKKY